MEILDDEFIVMGMIVPYGICHVHLGLIMGMPYLVIADALQSLQVVACDSRCTRNCKWG